MGLAWHNLLHDRLRFAVTVAGIAFAVFLMVFEGSLLAGFMRASSTVVDATDADLVVTARGIPAFDFPAPLPDRFREMAFGVPGIARVDRMVVGFAQWHLEDGSQQGTIVIGADPGIGTRFPVPSSRSLPVGQPEAVVVDRSDFQLLGIRDVPGNVEIGQRRARVVEGIEGFGSFLGSPYVFASYRDAKRYAGIKDQQTTYLFCRVRSDHDVEQVKRSLAARLEEADVWTRQEFASRTKLYWIFQTGAGGAILTAGLLGFIVGVVIVSQTIYATTMENIEEYATLRAMGAESRFLCRIVTLQALLGGLFGYGLGLLAAIPTVAAMRSAIPWIFTPWWMPLGMLVAGLIMCVIASLTSIRTVVRVEPGRVFRA